MSLRYKVFGIPGTFYEFVEKVRDQGEKHVDINTEAYNDLEGFFRPSFNYHCVVNFQAGKIKFQLTEHIHRRGWNLFQTIITKAEIEQKALKDAVKAARILQGHNLETKINGESIDEARKAIAQYDKHIKIMKKKLSSYGYLV